MMRQIRFRGKRKDTGEWVYGDLVHTTKDTLILPIDEGWSQYTVNSDTIGQFTGLLDANGKEIYENDIIRLEPDSIAIVLWNEEQSAFCIRLIQSSKVGSRPLGNWINYLWRKIEVIGSIHDNPELLK